MSNNQEKQTIFQKFASITGYVRSLMLAQKRGTRISELWSKLTFLLEQQINFILKKETESFKEDISTCFVSLC